MSEVPSAQDPVQMVLDIARRHGRADVADRLTAALARSSRRRVVVAVVGDYKQGKSTLINALVGAELCPRDDYEATALLTIVFQAATPSVTVVMGNGDEEKQPLAGIDGLSSVVLSGDGALDGAVRAEVAIQQSELGPDVALVDTPGVGALTAARADAAVGFLPLADAVIFTKDAGAELGAAGLAFLQKAVEVCGLVCVALTKTDTFPDWRTIRERDAMHLEAARLPLRIFPVAPQLVTGRDGRPELLEESGVGELRTYVAQELGARGAQWRWRREQDDLRAAASQLVAAAESELTGLASESGTMVSEAEVALRHARKAAGRWATELSHELQTLGGDLDHTRGLGIRAARDRLEGMVATVDPGEEWPDIAARIQREVADLADQISATLAERTRAASLAASAVLGIEPPDLEVAFGAGSAERLIHAVPSDPGLEKSKRIGTAIDTLRGSYGGMLLLGMFANLVAIPAALPVSVGVGVAFGARQFREVSRRSIDQRRQVAARVIRQTLDTADFDLAAQIRRLLRDVSKELADHYTVHADSAVAVAEAAYRGARATVDEAQEARRERRAILERDLAMLRTVGGGPA